MRPKQLTWEHSGKQFGDYWVGTLKGNFVPITFTVQKGSCPKDNEYIITSNITGLPPQMAHSLEGAKDRAQEIFQAYALNLFDLISSQ